MKKLLTVLIVLFSLTITSVVIAEDRAIGVIDPDPDDNTSHFVVKLDNGEAVTLDYPLKVDLEDITEGAHIVSVQSANVWGVRGPVNFPVLKKLPPLPSGFMVTRDSEHYSKLQEGP